MNYRKIYEQHYGPIPRDLEGRRYDIHHIDGNHANNSPKNLKAVTIQEHYNIHSTQGDYIACYLIARKMKLSPQELSEIASKANRERLENGTHNFIGGNVWRGRQHTEETKKLMSLAKIGKSRSEETKYKIGVTRILKKLPPPTFAEKQHSEETKYKISQALIGKKRGPYRKKIMS